jgi:hypothetical protein
MPRLLPCFRGKGLSVDGSFSRRSEAEIQAPAGTSKLADNLQLGGARRDRTAGLLNAIQEFMLLATPPCSDQPH